MILQVLLGHVQAGNLNPVDGRTVRVILDGFVQIVGRNAQQGSIFGHIQGRFVPLKHHLEEFLGDDGNAGAPAQLSQNHVQGTLQEGAVPVFIGGEHALEQGAHEYGVVKPETLHHGILAAQDRVGCILEEVDGESAVVSDGIAYVLYNDFLIGGHQQKLPGIEQEILSFHFQKCLSLHQEGETDPSRLVLLVLVNPVAFYVVAFDQELVFHVLCQVKNLRQRQC